MTPFPETALQTRDERMDVDVSPDNRRGLGTQHLAVVGPPANSRTVFLYSLLLSAIIAFLIPKQYESTTRMMPPEQQGMGAAMLAALAGKAMPGGRLARWRAACWG